MGNYATKVSQNMDFIAAALSVSAKQELRIANIFSCNAHAILIIVETSLAGSLMLSTNLCNLLLYGYSPFSFEINRSIIELTTIFTETLRSILALAWKAYRFLKQYIQWVLLFGRAASVP